MSLINSGIVSEFDFKFIHSIKRRAHMRAQPQHTSIGELIKKFTEFENCIYKADDQIWNSKKIEIIMQIILLLCCEWPEVQQTIASNHSPDLIFTWRRRYQNMTSVDVHVFQFC